LSFPLCAWSVSAVHRDMHTWIWSTMAHVLSITTHHNHSSIQHLIWLLSPEGGPVILLMNFEEMNVNFHICACDDKLVHFPKVPTVARRMYSISNQLQSILAMLATKIHLFSLLALDETYCGICAILPQKQQNSRNSVRAECLGSRCVRNLT